MTITYHTQITLRPGAVRQLKEEDFGLTDSKGRQIGFRCTIIQVESVIDAQRPRCGWALGWTDTKFWSLTTSVTRDGHCFGASTPPFHALTMKEVKVEATRRTIVARKRYLKKYAVA